MLTSAGQTAECLTQLKRLDQPKPVRARAVCSELALREGQVNDRIVPGLPEGPSGVDDDRRVVSAQGRQQLDPAVDLVHGDSRRQARGRSRSTTTQPSWSSPCGLPSPTIKAHDSTTLSFKEWVAQLMHGS